MYNNCEDFCPCCGRSTTRKMKIVKVTQTCYACPSQWDAWVDNGDRIYVRYRWGGLTITYFGQDSKLDGDLIFSSRVGDGLDGVLEYNELRELTEHIIDWPYQCENQDWFV